MRVGIVGSGGREAALAHVLSSQGAEVVVTPGNAGIPGSTLVPIGELDVDLVVIGPETPLVEGLADRLRERGRLVVGPGADGARLEGSKVYMKWVLSQAEIPTARFQVVGSSSEAHDAITSFGLPCAVKTDWLAAGKGVTMAATLQEALTDTGQKLATHGGYLVIEEGLTGEEVSVMFLCDGKRAMPLPVARDYKRLLDGDQGPNTGGMGAFCPVPELDCMDEIQEMVDRTLHWLRTHGTEYRGVLYAGVMLTEQGPKMLEYNIRFGDPEAQVILPLVGNLLTLLTQAAEGDLRDEPEVLDGAAVTVTLAAAGYPGIPEAGMVIENIEEAEQLGALVFHGGTARNQHNELVVAGGRVLYPTGVAATKDEAWGLAYRAAGRIYFEGRQCRSDIAA